MRAELNSTRRSLVIGGTFTRNDVEQLLDTCDRLLNQHDEIVRVLDDLGPAWTDARTACNQLDDVLQR